MMKPKLVLLICIAALMSLAVVQSANSKLSASSSQCRATTSHKKVVSSVFRTLMLKYSMTTAWCSNGQKVTVLGVTCRIDYSEPVSVDPGGCNAQWSYSPWGSNPQGSLHVNTSVVWHNGLFRIGSWATKVSNLDRWYYADGAVTKSPR